MICVGCGADSLPMRIWPPCRDTIWGTATGRIAGTAVPFVTGQGCLVLLVPADRTLHFYHTMPHRPHSSCMKRGQQPTLWENYAT